MFYSYHELRTIRGYMFMLMYQMKVIPEAHCLLDSFAIKIYSS